jgi:DNA-binding transcriptional LysR family regulator
VETVPLRKERMVVICHPQHPMAKSKAVKLADLTNQRFVAFEPDVPTRKAIDKVLKENGVEVIVAMEFDNVETVKRAVEIDAGIAIVPCGTVSEEVAKQTLVAAEVEDVELLRPLAAIFKKNKVLSTAMKQFIAILREE